MFKRLKIGVLGVILALTAFSSVVAMEADTPVKIEMLSSQAKASPGSSLDLFLKVDLQPGWHLYWKNPGEAGLAPTITWDTPSLLEVKNMEWSLPEQFDSNGMVTFGYHDIAWFFIEAQIDPKAALGEALIKGKLEWVACSDEMCLPGETPFTFTIQVDKGAVVQKEPLPHLEKASALKPQSLETAWVEWKADAVEITLPEGEVAFNDQSVPSFFPLKGAGAKSLPLVLSSEGKAKVSLPLDEASAEGLLVIGGKGYNVRLSPPPPKAQEPMNVGWALLWAFLGGLILNLMPCVLPVVSLKLIQLVEMQGQTKRQLLGHGLFFTAGVMVSFWLLAGFMVFLQWTGQAVGWGFQLQEPFVVALLVLLFSALALNLVGVFELGTGIASLAGGMSTSQKTKGPAASFWSGMLATAVATPCTGPFMGSAMGYAMTQPPQVSFFIFTALGLGMAFPFLIAGIFPKCVGFLPRPGAWMESFKQFLGFGMWLTVIWLLWVFSSETSLQGLTLLLGSIWVLSIGAWIYGRWGTNLAKKSSVRKTASALTFGLLLCSAGIGYVASQAVESLEIHANLSEDDWESFSPERVAELEKNGTPYFVDFTAKWCLTCQANHLVLSQDNVLQKFSGKGVVKMKADWTRRDQVITKELAKYGRNSVPLYVLHTGKEKAEPVILPQILTADLVAEALETVHAH